MTGQTRWIDLDGAVNVRDLGGLPTRDGTTTYFGRVLRADNLQGLSDADIRRLIGDLTLRDVIDLRTNDEVVKEGPGPLSTRPDVVIHHLSLFAEAGEYTDVEAAEVDTGTVLPWQDREASPEVEDRAAGIYLNYLHDRPDSIVAALRVMARSQGAAIVHCAAGKDRTGVLTALALEIADVTREAIVADYVLTGERIDRVLARLKASPTYAADLNGRPADSHRPRPETMAGLLGHLDERYGGPLGWLTKHGWSAEDSETLRARLRP